MLRVLIPVGLPPQLLVPIFAVMRSTYPRLMAHLRVSDDPIGGLLDDVDIALHFGSHSPPGPWVSYELLRMREWLVGHVDYLASRGTPASVEDLSKHELFSWEAPGEDPRVWPLCGGGTLPVEPTLIVSDIHMLRQFVIAGLGLAFVPDAQVPDPSSEAGVIVPVLPDLIGRERSLRLVVPSVLSDLPRIKAVMRHVRAFTDQL